MESQTVSQESLVLRQYYAKLVSVLAQCLNELLLQLVSEGVITIEDKNAIKTSGDTPNDRTEYLLDNHINRPLAVGITDNLTKLLKVMRMIPCCNSLVTELSQALKCDMPGPSVTSHPANSLLRDVNTRDETVKNGNSGIVYTPNYA